MMNKFFMTVGQVVVGVIIANVTTNVMDNVITKPLKKAMDAKKAKES